MADERQSDSTLGTAGSGDGAPRPLKTERPRPGPGKERVAELSSAKSDKASSSGPQDRPGSDPKNPGDFGHR
jgi:hypothetical protein